MNINGVYGLIGDSLSSIDSTAKIELSDNKINLEATNVLVNGVPISGGSMVTNPMSSELNANDFNIMNAGTILATQFVKNGGTSQQYLMGDGSALQYSANSGNSNFYLYDNGTDQDPTPASGFITYNAVDQKDATIVYISHKTRDNIDIDIFFKNLSSLNDVYIQDQSDSANSITYNITGAPTIVDQAQISIPVVRTASFGTGSTSFGNGHNILLSFFTNSIETDSRLTTLESKTQHLTATATDTICTTEFTVRNEVGALRFKVRDIDILMSAEVNCLGNRITNITTDLDDDVISQGGVNTLLAPIQEKIQNISATATETTISKNATVVLREAEPDFFLVQGDGLDLKLAVGRTSITCGQVVAMNNNKITGLGAPTLSADATTKNYVDTADALKLNLTGGTLSGSLTATSLIKTGGLATEFLKANGSVDSSTYLTAASIANKLSIDGSIAMTGALNMGSQKITSLAAPTLTTDAARKQYVDDADALQLNLTGGTLTGNLTAPSFIKTGGLTTQFLKANGDSDASTYLKADGTVAMTGALNMGNQNITAAGSVTATSFVKTTGTATQYLLANGTVDSRSMSTTQVIQVSNLTSSGTTEFNMTPTATIGSWAWTDNAIGYTRQVTIHGLLNRTNNTATTWSLRIKTNDIENAIIAFPASPNTIVANVPWTMYITWTRYLTAALMWNIRWESAEATTAGYWRTTTQNAGGSVVALGVLAAYTLTMQSNVATSTLNVVHANVQNIYTG